MIRFLVRSIGLWILAAGFAAVVLDGTKSIAAARLVLTALATTWAELAPASLAAAGAFVETRLSPALWATLRETLLALPTWAVLAVIGSALIALARPPAEKIGVTP